MNHTQIKQYCANRLIEIRAQVTNGTNTAFDFVILSAYIDFLSKLAAGRDNLGAGYKKFIKKYFPPKYNNFIFVSNHQDLPEQLYHVLRCGIIHCFSMYPKYENRGKKKERTIVISHDGKSSIKKYGHLDNFTENGLDAAIIIASNFCDDIDFATQKMFQDSAVLTRAERWVKKQPPLGII